MTKDSVGICEKGGKGQFLPLFGDWEAAWPPRLKVVLYFCGLVYCFLGVSIVADMFMSAIERITSRKRVHRVAGSMQRAVTCTVWNTTVANLTLMALGSSAPEILLSVNDIIKQGFFSGKLGPSTIVGSAAFNLFVIIAVCVNSVPDGEVRKIKETGVFAITAAFSIFAYVWVLFIVNFHSQNIIEVWEGVVTVLLFPLLVFVSYLADVGLLSVHNCLRLLRYLCSLCRPAADDEEDSADGVSGLHWCVALLGRLCAAVCSVPGLCLRLCRRRLHPRGGLEDLEHGDLAEAFDPLAPLLDDKGNPLSCEFGYLTFKADILTVRVGLEPLEEVVQVFRKNGTSGRVSCSYKTQMISATPGYDYEELAGEIQFRDGTSSAEIRLNIMPKIVGHRSDSFQLILEEPVGGVEFNPDSDGGEETCSLTVELVNENPGDNRIRSRCWRVFDSLVNVHELRLGRDLWKEQILDAITVTSSGEEEENPSCGDRILHYIWFPWQIIFAVATPPPAFLGGWICFWFSLLHIGWITVIISDLAELFGCTAGVDDEITAITFVALGTSVPDLFASRTAAKQDEWADASIVNVTGSNSVNVFLGIGLPWLGAALYWTSHPTNPDWLEEYGGSYPNGSFVVKGKNLAYTVAVFTLAASLCLVLITMRRYFCGGELGGRPDTKAYSSFFLFLLWATYITLSVWQIVTKNEDGTAQILSMVAALLAIGVLMVVFGFFRQLLKISKDYIGEEGFWGIFVASLIIGGRMLIFFMFQYQW
uniref:Calx-beta domain-containing protein n=1 Tax=Alexandrium monilatum TaxID=311494 RepID=A0A7S4Q7C8_9DINO|mmetsp:Transcript_19692/g.59414  ORF Transcript_19692/g.59414 Transcript_19692/m.59414 type:complete len:761 (-) Transcript_19692:94-2376(-)